MKQKATISTSLLLVISSIFIGIVLISIAFNVSNSYFFGKDVANAISNANKIKSRIHALESLSPGQQSDTMEIVLGNTVASMAFITRSDVDEYQIEVGDLLNCPNGYEGYIVIGPKIVEGNDWLFWENWKAEAKAQIMKKLQDKGFLGNLCISLYSNDDTFSKPGDLPQTLNGPGTYCIVINKIGPHLYEIETVGTELCE